MDTMDVYAEARDWVADCVWGDLDEEDLLALSNEQVRRGVERHYQGGWPAFLEASGLTLELAPAGPRTRLSVLAA